VLCHQDRLLTHLPASSKFKLMVPKWGYFVLRRGHKLALLFLSKFNLTEPSAVFLAMSRLTKQNSE